MLFRWDLAVYMLIGVLNMIFVMWKKNSIYNIAIFVPCFIEEIFYLVWSNDLNSFKIVAAGY